MSLKVKATSGEKRELIPPGTYKSLITGIYDIGTQDSMYGSRHQVVVTWELHKKGLERPYLMSKFYTLSFNSKATLRADVESLLGKSYKDGDEFDLQELLETPCRLQIVTGQKKDGSPKDEIKSLMPLDDEDVPPTAAGNTVYFEIEKTNCDIPSEVPEWIGDMVRRSPEWSGHVTSAPVAAVASNGNGHKVDPDASDCPF